MVECPFILIKNDMVLFITSQVIYISFVANGDQSWTNHFFISNVYTFCQYKIHIKYQILYYMFLGIHITQQITNAR